MISEMDWRSLNKALGGMTETQVRVMLDDELSNRKRGAIARRLHQRLCALRTARERQEIMEKVQA